MYYSLKLGGGDVQYRYNGIPAFTFMNHIGSLSWSPGIVWCRYGGDSSSVLLEITPKDTPHSSHSSIQAQNPSNTHSSRQVAVRDGQKITTLRETTQELVILTTLFHFRFHSISAFHFHFCRSQSPLLPRVKPKSLASMKCSL